MDGSGAVARLGDTAALWSIGQASPADLVRAACDALVDGSDGDALRMLAGVSLRQTQAADVLPLVEAALAEVGLPYHPPGSRSGQEVALRAMTARAVSGALPPRELAAWTHRVFGHHGLPSAGHLADLHDVYGCLDVTDMTEAEVDADVVAEAQRIVSDSNNPTPTAAPQPAEPLHVAHPPSRADIVARFLALLDGSQSRAAVDRWATQTMAELDDLDVDNAVWWALDILAGVDLRHGPGAQFLHSDYQIRDWLAEFHTRCADIR